MYLRTWLVINNEKEKNQNENEKNQWIQWERKTVTKLYRPEMRKRFYDNS